MSIARCVAAGLCLEADRQLVTGDYRPLVSAIFTAIRQQVWNG